MSDPYDRITMTSGTGGTADTPDPRPVSPPSELTAEEEADYRAAWALVRGMQTNEIGTLIQRLFATLDAARTAPLHYVPVWREWEKFEDKAAKRGSGATQEQMTGAAMMLGWLLDTYLPALASGSAPAEPEEKE